MANPALLQKKNGQYLWFSLLGLGFQPDVAVSSIAGKTNINAKHIIMGPNMFDKPNKDGFYIVTHFLLEKLNRTRFHEAYRHCWPVLNPKADAEFRKVTCAWLREIMEETANTGSRVVASLFLSPGGPKFVSLMLHLAKHVMLQEMKTFAIDGSWVPEAAAMPASTSNMAVKRFNLVRARFLKTAVEQDRFLHEYQRRAQLLVKSMRDIKAEGVKYDELLKRYSNDCTQEEGTSTAEKLKKVRSLWSTIDGMLSAIKEEQSAVESVLKGDVDQYTLDGTDRVLKIPRCLLERIEQLPHQLSSGNVYEANQLNLLCVMELMTHAVQLLKGERCRVSHAPVPQLNPQHLQEMSRQMARTLQDLHLIRQKISKEEIPEVRSAIQDLEAEWDKKWMDTLKETPLVSFLNEDPALGFLSPMAPLSFEPAAETSYKSSVFSQYPAKLLEEKHLERGTQDDVKIHFSNLKSTFPVTVERPESPVVKTETTRANTSLDWLFDTPPSPPQRAAPRSSPQVSVRKMTHTDWKVTPLRTKTQILNMEYDNLADQFADAVTTATPSEGRVKGLELEALLSSLQRDPFSARKQLPRTPESLIMDVKSSWRKAVEEDKVKKNQPPAEFNDSIIEQLTPVSEHHDESPSSESPSSDTPAQTVPSAVRSHSSPPVCQQGALHKSILAWDTFITEAHDSPGGLGSSVVHFSLDQETLPEIPGCDSLLSLDDEEMKSEDDDEQLIPLPKLEVKQPPLNWHQHEARNDGFLMEGTRTPECLLSDYTVSGLDRDWPEEPASSKEATDKIFSLDLDALKTPSPLKKQEYRLPELITFSPIDDMKC
ncbi:HAUS augmin-like complex subunit 6 [Oreochromis niloticus]|uniref:HAUS augmin-like complex subunit 6 N-terminal domain-containing protein n=1 Tax=Oreochromis niloticus TaxID=8128 RepID=I3K713_ORENI|nr:HAUS augmin-like complex subunit 6 [Oreochromis niloticus]